MPRRHLQTGTMLIWLALWLVGMAAIAYWCVTKYVPVLQQQIITNAQAAATSANAGDIDVSVVGRTATLSGVVSSDVQKAQLISVVEDAEGVRTVNDQLSVLKTSDSNESIVIAQQNSTATTEKDQIASQNTNENDTPTNAEADSLLEESASDMAKTEKADNAASEIIAPDVIAPAEQSIASSVNEADEQARVFDETNTAQLAKAGLQVAELALEPEQPDKQVKTKADDQLNERASALIEQARKETAGSLIDPQTPQPANAAPQRAQSNVVATAPPSFRMQIEADTLTLTGDISDQDSLLEFIRAAMSTFNANYVVNRVQVQDDIAKAQWLPALSRFLPGMSNIGDASIDIIESQITLSGIAASDVEHDTVIDKALSELSELSLVERIRVGNKSSSANVSSATDQTSEPVVVPEQSLEVAFDSLEIDRILFQSGSDVLTEDSLDVIETMATLFSKYPSNNIEINGHTDTSGVSANNLKLSQLRANAVRDYLIQQGVAVERLSAYGFGDGVPIADNSTPAGRRLNRRIDFNF